DPSGANAFDNASHRYEITVPAALAMPPIDAVAWTQLCSHASPPRLGQQSPHHLLGLFQPDGATLFVKVSGDSPIVVGFIGSHVQVISNPLHPSPQRLVLFAPPLGLGEGGGELLSQPLDTAALALCRVVIRDELRVIKEREPAIVHHSMREPF